jgi:predicted aspartyl protease
MARALIRGSTLAGAMAWVAVLQASQASTPQLDPADDLTEVIVRAPEPRYVAPTLRDRIGRVWVPVHINDKGPFRLVLDSGATNSAIIPRVAEQLGLSTADSPKVLMRGVTGAAITPTVRVASMVVGDLEIGQATLPLVPDAFGGAEGLLGTEGMGDKRIYIDFRNDFVNISRSRNRRADLGFHSLPLLRGAGKLLVVRASVANVRARAIIDTGAQASIGNLALREALERRSRREGSRDAITGATGDTQYGEGLSIRSIVIGGLIVQNAHITFGDMHIFSHWDASEEPTILIGMDVIGLVDTLVIDYLRQELHIKPRAGAADDDRRSRTAG